MDSDYVAGNLGFDLVRATEATALVAGRWVGLGERVEADRAASQQMRIQLDQVNMRGTIVIGERPQHVDENILGRGLSIGNGQGQEMDVVVDSIEGIRLLAEGLPGAISVAALAPRGAIQNILPIPYIEKIVVGPKAAHALNPECLDAPPAWTLAAIARALDKDIRDMTVFVLNRERHQHLIEDIRASGARVILRPAGDVVGALLASTLDSGIDMLMGIGGTSEGVVSACALKTTGGAILTRLAPRNEEEKKILAQADFDPRRILTGDDLVASNNTFFAATGITEGLFLRGVRYRSSGWTTHSLILRGETRTRRYINTDHLDQTY